MWTSTSRGAVITSVDHLVALGHRQIGFLAAAPNDEREAIGQSRQ